MSNSRSQSQLKGSNPGRSPSVTFTNQPMSTNPPQSSALHQQPQRPQREKSKKKNSCGDRRQQRFRAKLRKRGFDNETITRMSDQYTSTHREPDQHQQTVMPDMNVELLMLPVRDQVG